MEKLNVLEMQSSLGGRKTRGHNGLGSIIRAKHRARARREAREKLRKCSNKQYYGKHLVSCGWASRIMERNGARDN